MMKVSASSHPPPLRSLPSRWLRSTGLGGRRERRRKQLPLLEFGEQVRAVEVLARLPRAVLVGIALPLDEILSPTPGATLRKDPFDVVVLTTSRRSRHAGSRSFSFCVHFSSIQLYHESTAWTRVTT